LGDQAEPGTYIRATVPRSRCIDEQQRTPPRYAAALDGSAGVIDGFDPKFAVVTP
jgi:hypothetical protein